MMPTVVGAFAGDLRLSTDIQFSVNFTLTELSIKALTYLLTYLLVQRKELRRHQR